MWIGGIVGVLSVIGIIAIAVAISIPIIKMGFAAKSLSDLSGVARMIRQSPLDMVTKELLRYEITSLALQNVTALFDAFGDLIQELLMQVVYLVLGGLIIKAAFAAVGAGIRGASHAALRVAKGAGSAGDDMMVVERIISKGEKIVDVVDEVKSMTFQTGKEHAVVKLANGERAIVSGGARSISFKSEEVRRIFGHSHT